MQRVIDQALEDEAAALFRNVGVCPVLCYRAETYQPLKIQKLRFFETSPYVKLPSTQRKIPEDQNSQSKCFGLTGPTRGGSSIHLYLIKSIHLYLTNGIHLYLTNGIRLVACYKEYKPVSHKWYTPVISQFVYIYISQMVYTYICFSQMVYASLYVTKSIQKSVKLQGQGMWKLILKVNDDVTFTYDCFVHCHKNNMIRNLEIYPCTGE